MAELIQLIISSGPAVLLILAGLVWGKNFIEFFFKETIELKKDELNQNLEIHKKLIEQENKNFQHNLDTKLTEFNIQFSKLHQERAEAIKNLYSNLVELQTSMVIFTRTVQPVIEDAEKEGNERLERVNKAIDEFVRYYTPNKIFFNKELAKKIDYILNEYWNKGWDFAHLIKDFKHENLSPTEFKEYYKKSKEISETVKNEFALLFEELEDEFRKILGVN